jgi:glycogen phosphorylase
MKITPYNVMPRLPEALEPLRDIAFNIWFSWNWEAVQLFIRLDPEYWEKTYQNPTLMLGVIPQSRFEEMAEDESFVAKLNRVHAQLNNYMDAKTWFDKTHPEAAGKRIAYFSTEYGIDVGLPIYSGGLGVLAGDHLKSASDLGLPLVAMGLLYREGYLKQYLTADGWQQEAYPTNDWYNMPVVLVTGDDGEPIVESIDLAGERVVFQVWKVQVGRVPMYLLDTDLEQNSAQHRAITTRLYAGERDMRLRQEILLGVGGMKALYAMGIEPNVTHMNEGHSAFLALERTRLLMEHCKLTRQEAWEIVWATTVFTTHTPVPAGNERFDPHLVKHYLEGYLGGLDLGWDEFLAMGREDPKNAQEEFCLTILALHHAAHNNGVSKLHGATSRHLWKSLWPGVPTEEVPIKSVTNGIHVRSWLSHDMTELCDSYFGPKFLEEPMALDVWNRVQKIPDGELWRTHERRRERLVWFARKRVRQQLERRGAQPYLMSEADQVLDPCALTIGFARRFASYKRATLILEDPKRLAAILNDTARPVQIIFAGKAHPMDRAGKKLMQNLIHFIRQDDFRHRIVFLEDYDINVARYMVQGVDVWLNTPRKPQEASGTSGMKATANGALHFSTYDGWWCEGYTPDVGWTIGYGEEYDDVEKETRVESGIIYDIIERQIVPTFYDRAHDGLPHSWIERMKKSMMLLGPYFSTNRMVADYSEEFYIKAGAYFDTLTADNAAKARELAAWRGKLKQNWSHIHVESVESNADSKLGVGDRLSVTARVRLGAVAPDEVEVQLYSGILVQGSEVEEGEGVAMTVEGDANDGVYTYRCDVDCIHSGRRAFSVRVLPKHANLVHPIYPGLIRWA